MLRGMDLLDGLYHRELLWSNQFYWEMIRGLKRVKTITFSYHCLLQINSEWNRKYEELKLDLKTIEKGSLFEVEIKNNRIIKYAVRTQLNNDYDISIVFIIRNQNLFVKTMWLNNRKDNHITLKKENYVCI